MTWKFLPYSMLVLGGFFFGVTQPVYGAEGVAAPAVYPADSWEGWSKATVRVLDRLESRSVVLTLSVGEEQHYRSLNLKLLACIQRPPTLAPETAAQLHMEDSKAKVQAIFEGWLFANQPSLSLYQSSLYNVQIIHCSGEKVPPLVGALPTPSIPQITSSEPERLDADGQAISGQGSVPTGGEPTSLIPQAEPQPSVPPTSRPAATLSPSPSGALAPPTPLLP